MNNTSFNEVGCDSDFADEGDTSSSSSSSYQDLTNLDKMLEALDLIYFETNLMRNNIAHFEYFYNNKKRTRFRTTQSCPARIEQVYNDDEWIKLDKIRCVTPNNIKKLCIDF
tara:strand:+ start:686 stop:1021 length:336 start_codon:yes stop_codon:yes gene_type:complete